MQLFHGSIVRAVLTVAIVFVVVIVPAMYAQSTISPSVSTRSPPVYADLSSRVFVSLGYYPLVNVTVVTSKSSGASVFYGVGTFIQPSQCCYSGYIVQVQVDGAVGTACGGQTSQFTGVLVENSCFGRLNLSAGSHMVSLVLFVAPGAGGPFVVEAGTSTSLLVQLD